MPLTTWSARSAALRLGAVAGLAALGWWVTGLAPFTSAAYVVVGATIAAVAVVDLVSARSAPPAPRAAPDRRGAAPWVVLVVVAVALEAAGLALGGRSPTVPTLSTVVDHALATHAVRFVVFAAWLTVGLAPAARQRLGSAS